MEDVNISPIQQKRVKIGELGWKGGRGNVKSRTKKHIKMVVINPNFISNHIPKQNKNRRELSHLSYVYKGIPNIRINFESKFLEKYADMQVKGKLESL